MGRQMVAAKLKRFKNLFCFIQGSFMVKDKRN
jgi:hypothetical protein